MQIRKNCKNESKLSNDILVFMSHDEGGVDHMKDSLYSRKHQGGMGDVRAPLSPSESHAPVAWPSSAEATGGQARRTSIIPATPRERMALATKFLIGSAAFFVLAIGGAAIFFFSGGNYISPKNIDLQVVAPALVDGGSTGNLQFIITNRNSAELQLADLVIEYPSGTRDPKNPQKSLNNERIPVGAIAPGQQIKLTSSAVFYGSEGDTQIIKASLEYSVQGSNAVFVKEGSASITIGSSPVSVRVETQSEAISGQPFTIKVTVQSNSPAPVQDVLVQAQYPFGYSVQSATPRADAGSTLWRLGTMAPGATQVITVTGSIDGQDGDERVFRFLAGSNKDQTAGKIQVPFLSVPATLTVRRPFITAGIAVDGKTGPKISATAGKSLHGTVTWQNNLQESVSDVQIKLKFSGVVFDRGSVQPGGGFYQSNDNTITWTSAQDPSLASVPPGGSGTLQFSFNALAPGAGGTVYTNPTIDLSLTVGAVRTGQGDVPDQISSAASTQITLASAIAIAARALHFTGGSGNSGPMPPRAETATTYTIEWSAKNSSNTVANTTVLTVLPVYVTFVAAYAGSDITYDAGSRTVRWDVGDLGAGVGYSTAARKGSFRISFMPSSSQVGLSPQLTGTAVISGTDRFAQVQVSDTVEAPTTKLTEPGFVGGMDIVAPKQ